MTEDQTLMELDARARRAAAAVKREVADIPVGTFDPDRIAAPVLTPVTADAGRNGSTPSGGRSSARRWLPLVSIAAALILLAVTAGLVVVRKGEQRPASDVASGEPAGLQVGSLPAGFALSGVVIGSPDERPASRMAATFGPDPQGTALAVIGIETDSGLSFAAPDGGRPVRVGGRDATVTEANGLPAVYVRTGPKRQVALLSATLYEAALLQAASHLELDDEGAPGVAAAGLPAGWRRLGTMPSEVALGGLSSVDRDGVAVGYADLDASRSISVVTGPGTEADLYAPKVLLKDVTPTTVRGHDAVVGSVRGDEPSAPTLVLSWFEEPGRLVRQTTSGLTEAQAKQVAESLEPLGGVKLRELASRTRVGDFDEGSRNSTAVATGRTPEGKEWTVRVGATGQGVDRGFSVKITGASGDSSSSSSNGSGGRPAAGPLGAIGNERVQSTRIVYGLGARSVAAVRVTYGAERRTIEVRSIGDAVGYGFEVPIDAEVRIEALDASGKVLDTAIAGADDVSTSGGATTTTVP